MSSGGRGLAGRFYPADPVQLREEVRALIGRDQAHGSGNDDGLVAMIVPHAALAYSGPVAGKAFGRLGSVERAIIIGPNHTGLGPPVSCYSGPHMETPLGRIEVDRELGEALCRADCGARWDARAHLREHSIEVQLPFLQVLNGAVRVLPICMRMLPLEECESLGKTIASVCRRCDERVLIVASSDLNHNDPMQVTLRKDRMLLSKIGDIDPAGLYRTAMRHRISMCGVVPVVTAMVASIELGANTAEVVSYSTSAEVDGDQSRVVGYASILLSASGDDPRFMKRPFTRRETR